MSLESVFKLSLIMNMIDNLSGPMAGVASKVGANVSKLDAASQTFGNMAKAGAAMQETGSQIVNAVLAPVEATFETRRALGELASLGVQDLEAVENADLLRAIQIRDGTGYPQYPVMAPCGETHALKGGLHQRGLRHQERHRLPL